MPKKQQTSPKKFSVRDDNMDLKDKLKKEPLLFDGAMGTYYIEKYGHEPEYCEMANLEMPDRIEEIHREYISAGADALKTNTFGANTLSLKCEESKIFEIIRASWAIAQKAVSGTETAIFANIGPIPYSKELNACGQYLKIVDTFLELGAENFLFETFSSTQHLAVLARHIKQKLPSATIFCSFAVYPDGFTREGVPISRLIDEIGGNANIDAFGFNCACGPVHIAKLVSEVQNLSKPLSAMPNSGYPTLVGNRTYYENNSDYYAKSMATLRFQGVSIFGGCCGTTPEHIKKLEAELKNHNSSPAACLAPEKVVEQKVIENNLWTKLENGKRVFAVELDPPATSDISKFIRGARILRDAGIDAITIADCPVSRARADSSILACKIRRELGIAPIPHMTCRDRNIIATKALLLGLNIEGVNNVLVVTGDPIPTAERGTIKSVFNFNSMILASFIRDLGPELENGPFKIFGALNLNALNFDSQLRHAQDKLGHGVNGFLTQPVHSKRALDNLKLARHELNGKILGGVMPIVSYKNACYMNSEIAGITVSDDIIKQYEGLDREAASRLAVKLTTEIAISMSDFIDGYYMITPFSRTDLICEIMHNLK